MEATSVSVDKESVVRVIHNGLLLHCEKEDPTKWMGLEDTILRKLVMEEKNIV